MAFATLPLPWDPNSTIVNLILATIMSPAGLTYTLLHQFLYFATYQIYYTISIIKVNHIYLPFDIPPPRALITPQDLEELWI